MLWTIHYNEASRRNIKDYSSIDYMIPVEDILRLKRSLRNVYPELTNYFDRKRNLIPGKIENHAGEEGPETSYQSQDSCKHEKTKNVRDDDMGYYMRECVNCHKKWKIKRLVNHRK